MAKNVLEVIGFLLVVAAAYTVGVGLALLVAGVGLIIAANDRPKPTGEAETPL